MFKMCHHYDVMQSPIVTSPMTIWLSTDNFVYVLYRNQTISYLIFWTSSLIS